jgi:Pyruvate/2-oxoacid:ferredoxin oxidoreductase gamma subunit
MPSAEEMAALNTAMQAAVGSLTGRILHLEAQARAQEEQLEVQMQAFADQ